MGILLPVILVMLPLLILPGVVFYYDITPKVAVLLFGTAACLLLVQANGKALLSFWSSGTGRLLTIVLGAQQVSLILSTAFSWSPGLSMGGTIWRRFGLVSQSALVVLTLLACAHFASDRGILRRALQAMAGAGCAMSVYGIAQFFGWDPLLPSASYLAGEGAFQIVRPPGTLGHAGYFATYLLCTLAAGVALYKSNRALAWGAALLIPTAIVLSGTRAAILGLLVGAVVLAILWRPSWRAIAAACVVCCCVLAIVLFSPAGGKLLARVHWSVEDAGGGARLLLWRDTLRMATGHGLMGNGLETFGSTFPAFQSVDLSRAYPDFYHESPHNVFLDVLTAQGALGLSVFLVLCGIAVRQSKDNPPLAAGLIAALVSLQFTSLTVATALALLTLIAALSAKPVPVIHRRMAPAWKVVPVGIAVVLTVVGVRLMVADWHLQQAKFALDAGSGEEAYAEYQAATDWAVAGSGSDLYISRRFASSGRLRESLLAGVRATQSAEDRQNAFYNLAALHAASGDAMAVEADLKAAILSSPHWYKAHWTLAELYVRQSRLEEAASESEIAVKLAGGKHAEVTRTRDRILAERKRY